MAAVGVAAMLVTTPAHANLITNGGFGAGNTGFTSGYTSAPSSFDSMLPETTYAIAGGSETPAYFNQYWGSDITAHSGQSFMVVNGATAAGIPVWGESGIAVTPDTNYVFSTWVVSLYPTSPAVLDFSINGSEVGGLFTAGTTAGIWQEFDATWNSGSATTVNISILDQNLAAGGNDFGLDDIALNAVPAFVASPIVPVPEPISIAVLGAAAAGLGLVRRRGPLSRAAAT